jgi:hypothetical protein
MAALVASCLLPGVSCDRDDLTSGPKIDNGGGIVDPPDDCPEDPPLPGDLAGRVFINEVMVKNNITLEDDRGEYPPWMEIYNATEEELDLSLVSVSDSFVDTGKWRIPCIPEAIVPPGGFLIIYLDDDEEDEAPDDLHASFTLPPDQPYTLILNGGSDFFSFDDSEVVADQSGGRLPDGGNTIGPLDEPTPGAPNDGAAAEPLEGTFLRGDANKDDRVNVTDMNAILKVLFHAEPAPVCEDRLDANDDGIVDLSDSLYIGNALFLRGRGIPEPYPSEGADPTGDELPCPAP